MVGIVVAAQNGGGGSRYDLPRTVTVTPAAMFMFLAPHLYG
jgi:hypothetical protein